MKENNLGYPRFAFIISKKISKKAVDRNRGKRLLREAVRKVYPLLKNESYDIILIARKDILGKKLQDVLEDFQTLLKTFREKNEKNSNSFN